MAKGESSIPSARELLTKREIQIAEKFAEGAEYRTIAAELFLAPTTVRTHLQNVYRKLEVSNKVSLGHALKGDADHSSQKLIETKPNETFGLTDQSDVQYARSRDNIGIAYATVGEGYPLLIAGSWLTHLKLSWEPLHLEGRRLSRLAERFRLFRYDQRGSGLSDWGVPIDFEKMVDDLECVVESIPFEKVAIYARSQGAAVSIAYLARRSEKVTHLILQGAYARGRRRRNDPAAEAQSKAMVTLIREGWGADNPAFRQVMTTLFAEASSPEEIAYFNEFQRKCGPASNIARYREMFDEVDVSSLAKKVSVPSLILHSEGDAIAPISEAKFLATAIPGAKLVTFNSDSHLLRADDPAFEAQLSSMTQFIHSHAP